MYSYQEVLQACLGYFQGDELAATTWINKYCLRDQAGNLLEKTPKDMHDRMIEEILRIEDNYRGKKLTKKELQEMLYDFKYIVPGGSIMSSLGNRKKFSSLSNCFVIGTDADSYGGIMQMDQELIQLSKRRGGVGLDLSFLRPYGAVVSNDARSSTGVASFMERFSNSAKEVAQEGRRGALMLTIDIKHPDAEKFIDAKLEEGKVTGANISVKLSKEFMSAAKHNNHFYQVFPVTEDLWEVIDFHDDPADCGRLNGKPLEIGKLYQGKKPGTYIRKIDAAKLWTKITDNAWKRAEPGVLFWDKILKESPADQYTEEGFGTVSTNPCLHPDTIVRMADGSHKKICDIREGDKVYSYDFLSHKLVTSTVRWVGVTKKDADLVKEVHYGLRCTPDHLIYDTVSKSYKMTSEVSLGLNEGLEEISLGFKEIKSKSDVWDIMLDSYHNFFADGVLVHNCGEIPLTPYDSCRLLSLNIYSFVKNPYTSKAKFDFDLLVKAASIAQQFMDDVIDLEVECIQAIISKVTSDPQSPQVKATELELWNKILQKTLKGRRTGIGMTGLGDTLAALGLRYGSEQSIEVIEDIARSMAISCYSTSIRLAKERGSFPLFNVEKDFTSEFTKRMYSQVPISSYKDWKEFGRRNISCLTCAPSGTISIMTRTTSGIEPLFMPWYTRRRKTQDKTKASYIDKEGIGYEEFKVLHPKFIEWFRVTNIEMRPTKLTFEEATEYLSKQSEETLQQFFEMSPYFEATAQTIDYVTKVHLQGTIQTWIDHSISCTCNLPKDISKEVVKELYETASECGCKGLTVYRDGCREGVLVETPRDVQVSYLNTPRPEELHAEVYRFKNNNENWIAFIGLRDSKPYEIFTGKLDGQIKWLPKDVNSGIIKKVITEEGKHRYDFIYDAGFGYNNAFPAISERFEREYWNYARFTSGMLRAGLPLEQIIAILRGLSAEEGLSVWKAGVARALSKFVKDGTKTGSKCEECGAELIFEGGCSHCPNCGASKCG